MFTVSRPGPVSCDPLNVTSSVDIVFHEEQSVRGRKEKLKLYALDIKKPDTAPGTDVAPAKPAEWKTDEPAPDTPPAPALG